MNLVGLNRVLNKFKKKYIVVPFIFGKNEDGENISTIYYDKVKDFSFIKTSKKGEGFIDYMENLETEFEPKFSHFSIVCFLKVNKCYYPICELSKNLYLL